MPRSAAERQRDYRKRKRAAMQTSSTKTPAKSAAQRTREYRERKRLAALIIDKYTSCSADNIDKLHFTAPSTTIGNPGFLALNVDRLHNKYLCQDHFSDHCFMNYHKKKLTPTAVPYRYDVPSEENASTSAAGKNDIGVADNLTIPYCIAANNIVPNMVNLSEVVSKLKKMAPLSLAGSWDNVGLLVEPDVKKPIECVFLTNDLTEDVLEEAESVNANLIVSYHPPVFAPFKRITLDTWKGRIVSRCLSQGIAVYSPHTSWDAVENGLTDWLISCFDGNVSPIKPLNESPEFSHMATLSSDIDGLQILEILECQSGLKGNKEFKVLNYNNSQLQLLCNLSVLSLLKDVTISHDHIYLHANKNELLPSSRPTAGDGRYCQLKDKLTISNAVQMIKSHLGVDNLMIAMARGSTMESTINSAAAVAGSGASLLRGVKADLYLTGEMSHHDLLDAVHDNVTVVLANHSNTERSYLKVFAGKLLEELPQLTVHVSKVDKDPLVFV